MADSGLSSESRSAPPILLVGLPRSGTTWVGRALGAAAGARAVLEPDNEDNSPYAIRAKAGLGRYPLVLPGEQPPNEYEALWQGAFRGGRAIVGLRSAMSECLHAVARSRTSVHQAQRWSAGRRMVLNASVALSQPGGPAAARVIVKTVFSPFALSWIVGRWSLRPVLLTRSPWSIVASWTRRGWDPPFFGHPVLGWPDVDRSLLSRLLPDCSIPAPPPPSAQIRRLSWELAVMMSALVAAMRNSGQEPVLVAHEDLCRDPLGEFQKLYADLGLTWTPATTGYLQASDVAGGGAYDTKRVANEEPKRWRDHLSDRDADEIKEVVANFDIPWSQQAI